MPSTWRDQIEPRPGRASTSVADRWEVVDSVQAGNDDDGDPIVRERFAWPALVVAIGLMVLLWSTGPEGSVTVTPPTVTVDRAPAQVAVPIDRTLVLPGEEVFATDPLVVLGAIGPEARFFPGVLGEEIPFADVFGVEAAIVLATGDRLDDVLMASLGFKPTIEKVTLVGRFEGRLISTIWFSGTTASDDLMRCRATRDNDELTATSCVQAGPNRLSDFYSSGRAELGLDYFPERETMIISGLSPKTAVVAVIGPNVSSWQRPSGEVAVLVVEVDAAGPVLVRVFDPAGTEITSSSVDLDSFE